MKKTIFIIAALFCANHSFAQTLTQTRDDAGAPTVYSGFYETNNPINFPNGAKNWWHLLDVRHSNSSNNYAMQLAGSFESQHLWFRNTNNSATTFWSKILAEDNNGRVGIGGESNHEKLLIKGNHANTSLQLHADNSGNPHAYLTLWASEPNHSYTGVGIGNNIRNSFNTGTFVRVNNNTGGSYVRLLDNEINFNLISSTGTKQQTFTLFGNGNATLHGKLEAKEVKVTNSPTADFVFEENYDLPTLEFVEKHIKEKKHLPEIASAKVMELEGVNVGEFQIKLLQKIEELTLYTIDQNKQIKNQADKIETLQQENKLIKSLLERIEILENSK